MDTITDISVEKAFNTAGRVRPSLFLEVRNLFNQKDDAATGEDYMRWGLQMARPNDPNYPTYGDVGDRNFIRAPRRIQLGVRTTF
jgi:hypothetical protein